MAEIVPKETNKRTPKVQDLSELVDQTSRTLLDLDQRIQLMRNDLAAMMQQAAPANGNAQAPHNMPQAPQVPHSPMVANPPHMQNPQHAPNMSGVSWPNMSGVSLPNMPPGGMQDPRAGRPPMAWPSPFAPNFAGSMPGGFGQQQAPFGAAFGSPAGAPFAFGAPAQGRTQQIDAQQMHSVPGAGGPPVGQSGLGAVGGMTGSPGRSARELGNMPAVAREPASDIIDLGREFQITLDIPGVKKDDVDIMVTDRSVIVTGTSQPALGEGFVVVSERAPVQYRRTITLPNEIQTSECQAKLKDGVLNITVPKKVPTEGPRHINVAYA